MQWKSLRVYSAQCNTQMEEVCVPVCASLFPLPSFCCTVPLGCGHHTHTHTHTHTAHTHAVEQCNRRSTVKLSDP